MKKFKALFVIGLILGMCLSLVAQEPVGAGGAQRGGAGAAGGGRGGGGGGRGGGRGSNTPAPPRPTGPVVDATDAIIGAINNSGRGFL